MGKIGRSAVSVVVQPQCALLHRLFEFGSRFRIGAALRSGRDAVGVGINLSRNHASVDIFRKLTDHGLGIVHVEIVVAGVAHNPDSVFPRARLLTLSIGN